MCGDATETVRHIVSRCKKLAQRVYRKRHDKVALRVHWEMCRKYGIECNDKLYDHQPFPTTENGEVRITCDMTIYTDKVLKHNRPDIILVHKETQKWTHIDIAVPADQNITRTEEEKVENRAPVAQLVEHQAVMREVAGSNPGPINTQDLKITEEKVLPLQ